MLDDQPSSCELEEPIFATVPNNPNTPAPTDALRRKNLLTRRRAPSGFDSFARASETRARSQLGPDRRCLISILERFSIRCLLCRLVTVISDRQSADDVLVCHSVPNDTKRGRANAHYGVPENTMPASLVQGQSSAPSRHSDVRPVPENTKAVSPTPPGVFWRCTASLWPSTPHRHCLHPFPGAGRPRKHDLRLRHVPSLVSCVNQRLFPKTRVARGGLPE
jgi:hypothetical protein